MDRQALQAAALFNQLDDSDKAYILQYMEELTHRQQGRPAVEIEAFLRDRGEESGET